MEIQCIKSENKLVLKVMDIWHPWINGSHKYIYSDNEAFKNINEFLEWILSHQHDLKGVTRV